MIRKILYLIIIVCAFGFGQKLERRKIEEMNPIETIRLSKIEDVILLETDTGEFGAGRTVEEAVKALEETSIGDLFLDSVEFVMVERGTEDILNDLKGIVNSNCKIALDNSNADIQAITEYLRTHVPSESLSDIYHGTDLSSELLEKEGRFFLLKKE